MVIKFAFKIHVSAEDDLQLINPQK